LPEHVPNSEWSRNGVSTDGAKISITKPQLLAALAFKESLEFLMKNGEFRFTYFTRKYDETCKFYTELLGFDLKHSWDRSAYDKGSLFNVGAGLIEVLLYPNDENHRYAGLDYRAPQGAFMCVEVLDIDARFTQLKAIGIPFEQEITNQTWGHRSFSIIEPNGLIIFFFQEQVKS